MKLFLITDSWSIDFRQPFTQPFLDVGQLGFVRKVGEFVGVGLMLVELFLAIGMKDISIPLTSGGVVPLSPSGDGGALPLGFRVPQQGHETDAVEIGTLGQSA